MQITAKFQFTEQFPTVILRNIVTKNLDLYSGKRKKDEILHFVQNDRVESERITAKFQFSTTGALTSNCSFLIVYCPYVLSKQLISHN